MPEIQLANARYHYLEAGRGDETIVFAHGLLWSGGLFQAQIDHLSNRYRCIAFDFRGQGRSEVTKEGYDLDTLGGDVGELIERLGPPPVHYVGLSMGGMVGMRLAARQPHLLRSLSLLNTSAGPEPPEALLKNKLLALIARTIGLRFVAAQAMQVMFGRSTLGDSARQQDRQRWRDWLCSNDKRGIYRAATAVFNREPVEHLLAEITVPSQMIIGAEDIATPPDQGEQIAAGIAACRRVVIDRAGHSSTLEQPDAVNRALDEFFSQF